MCDDDTIKGIWKAGSDISHDVDENVFLDISRSRVQQKFGAIQQQGRL